MENHKFWKNESIDILKNSRESKYIKYYNMDETRKEPLEIPKPFEWCNIELNNKNELEELLEFITLNYFEDASKPVEFTPEFFKWLVMTPNYLKDLIIGIKCLNKLVACICGIPMNIAIFDKKIKIIQINFLCINPKLRNKNFAPILIKEITRRIKFHSIWAAIYTGSLELPNCLVQCTNYIRPLNIDKLVDLQIMQKPSNSSIFQTIKNPLSNIRKMEEKDCEICCEKFNIFHKKFKIGIYFELEYFKQHFLNIESYVVETNNIITDFFSFFPLHMILNNNNKYQKINRYILYYYFNFETKLDVLVENALYIIKKQDGDYVTCLDQYDNNIFIDKLNFKKASTGLNFFLYNWTCPVIDKKDLAVILI